MWESLCASYFLLILTFFSLIIELFAHLESLDRTGCANLLLNFRLWVSFHEIELIYYKLPARSIELARYDSANRELAEWQQRDEIIYWWNLPVQSLNSIEYAMYQSFLMHLWELIYSFDSVCQCYLLNGSLLKLGVMQRSFSLELFPDQWMRNSGVRYDAWLINKCRAKTTSLECSIKSRYYYLFENLLVQ